MGAAEPTMESRGRRPRTPERQRPPPRKVPVVYYLTRSRHLEHPHFVEVPVASPEGLYLRGQWNCSFSFYLRSCARLMAIAFLGFCRCHQPSQHGARQGHGRHVLVVLQEVMQDLLYSVFLAGMFFYLFFLTVIFWWCLQRVDRSVVGFRSYKNGFVWHDLAEDDLVLPATDGEYVLKGSELVDQSSPGKQ